MGELVVDGYNIAHAWPELAPLMAARRLEDARNRLVGALAGYAAATGERVTVVFDAHRRVPGDGRDQVVDGVTVVFGSTAQTADHVIERKVAIAARTGDAERVTVATGDRLQRDLVMAMGGAVIGPEGLRSEVLRAGREVSEHVHRQVRQAHLGSRLGDRLDAATRAGLEALRRPPAAPGDVDDAAGGGPASD